MGDSLSTIAKEKTKRRKKPNFLKAATLNIESDSPVMRDERALSHRPESPDSSLKVDSQE